MFALFLTALLATVDVPAAPPLLPNAPQYEWGVRLVPGHDRFLALYLAYTTEIAEILDAETGAVVSHKRLPDDFFLVHDAALVGDHFLLLVASSDGVGLAVLDEDAEPLGTPAIVVPNGWSAAIASMGNQALVVSGANGAIVDDEGRVLRRLSIPLHGAQRSRVAVAASNDRYLVLYADDEGIFATVFSRDGNAIATTKMGGAPPDPWYTAMNATSDGDGFLALWSGTTELKIVPIAADGGAATPLARAAPPQFTTASLTWNGNVYLAAYGQFIERISSAGVPIAPPEPAPANVAISAIRGRTLLAWLENAPCGSGSDIVSRFLDEERVQLVSVGIADQGQPTLTAAGGDFALAWSERSDVGHVRVSRGGLTKTAPSIGVASQGAVTLGSDGDGVLVLWTETRTDSCRSVLAAAPLDDFEKGSVIANDVSEAPGVVFNGADYAAVWANQPTAQLFAQHVGRNGAPKGSPVRLAEGESSVISHSHGIVWTGSGYIVVRGRTKSVYVPLHSPPPVLEIRMLRLSPDLAALGDEQIVAAGTAPSIAWDGSRALIVWVDSAALKGAFVTPDGQLSSPFVLADYLLMDRFWGRAQPHVIWSGREYLITAGPRMIRVAPDGSATEERVLPDDTVCSTAVLTKGGVVFAFERPAAPESRRIYMRVPLPSRRRATKPLD